MSKPDHAKCVWDFTSFEEDYTKVMRWCKKYCKKWVFQREVCPTSGNLHFQGRISLGIKKRVNAIKKDDLKFHFSLTSNENADNDFYCTDEDKRAPGDSGPWKDTDEEVYIPRQIREITRLYPWQNHVIADCGKWDTRSINIVLDMLGNIGKSTLVNYMRAHRLGRRIPPVNDFRDLMRMVMDMPTSNLYLIDMPRSMSKSGLMGLYSAIEEVKNGYAFDDRYHFKEKIFDCPNIWIFTNKLPDKNLLSGDRWKLWEVNENTKELDKLAPPEDWGENDDK